MYDLSCETLIFDHQTLSNSLASTGTVSFISCKKPPNNYQQDSQHSVEHFMYSTRLPDCAHLTNDLNKLYLSIVHYNQNSIQLDAPLGILSYYSIDVSNRVLLYVIFMHALNVCKLLYNIWMRRTLKFKIISQILSNSSCTFNTQSAIPHRQ
jgi:hypothetical protein